MPPAGGARAVLAGPRLDAADAAARVERLAADLVVAADLAAAASPAVPVVAAVRASR
jgi:hypothetical protein